MSLLRSAFAVLTLGLAVTLVGCAPEAGTDVSPSATSPSATPVPSPSDEVRFLIECVGLDGSVIGPFTRLEEAWASTNYVRIDHCTASGATSQPIELTPEEASIAETASADLPDEDPVDLYLLTLATCVRVAPTSTQPLSTMPTSLLRATLELCPDAPHSGLVQDELEARSP